MKVADPEKQCVPGASPTCSPQPAHSGMTYTQDLTVTEARFAAYTVVPATSGALREPHTVLTMSGTDLVLFWFCFLIRDAALILQSVTWHHNLVLKGLGKNTARADFASLT